MSNFKVTDAEYKADLEEHYPNREWELVPDADDFPDVWKVRGSYKDEDGNLEHFEIDKEYCSEEEAQAGLARFMENTKGKLIENWGNLSNIWVTKPWDARLNEFNRDFMLAMARGEKFFDQD